MAEDILRTFLAIELPEPVKEALGGLSRRVRAPGDGASWVRTDNIHLTLRFLGDVDAGQRERLILFLANAYATTASFPVHVQGIGAFPNMRRPSVVWVGVTPSDGPLSLVQLATENAARTIGLSPENKAFHPHLTLARIREPRGAEPLVARLETERGFDAGEFTVRGVSLFSSQLTPKGAVYTRLREFTFDPD